MTIAAAACICAASHAQTGVVARYPASDGEKILTMEEAVTGRNVRPGNVYARWNGNKYLFYSEGKWMEADPSTGEATAYSPQRLPASFPRQAANIIPGAPGTYAFTMGRSLYIFGPEGQGCVAGSARMKAK